MQLREVMSRLGVSPDRAKQGFALLGERLGRLKPNGQLTGYSPLSRLIEIEGLTLGVAGKLELWRSLKAAPGLEDQLEGIDLTGLARQAESQRERLQKLHDRAAVEALS